MALKVKYDLSETGGQFIKNLGLHKVKVSKVELKEGSDTTLIFTFKNQESQIIRSYVQLTGGGAFKFEELANAVGAKLKTSGGVDVEKWVGKQLDIIVALQSGSEYKEVAAFGKVGSLNEADFNLRPDDDNAVIDDEDFDDEDFEEEIEEKPKKKKPKKATKKKPEPVVEEEDFEEDDEDEEDEDDDEWI